METNSWKLALILVVGCGVTSVLTLERYERQAMKTLDPTPLVANKQVVDKFMDCFMDQAPCDPLGLLVKKNIMEVLETSCENCDKDQITLIKTVLEAFIPRYPDHWQKFLDKYDPERKHWPVIKEKLGISV